MSDGPSSQRDLDILWQEINTRTSQTAHSYPTRIDLFRAVKYRGQRERIFDSHCRVEIPTQISVIYSIIFIRIVVTSLII